MLGRSCKTIFPGAGVAYRHCGVIATDFRWSEVFVDSDDTVERRLPQHKPVEEVGGQDLPDLHNDCTNEPVDDVYKPITV